MHPDKGDNGCWLFGTDSSAVTAEGNKLRGCLNPTCFSHLLLLVFFFVFFFYKFPLGVSCLDDQSTDITAWGWILKKRGKKKPSLQTDDPWNGMKRMMTAFERMGGRDWFSGTAS